jgi:hypothetical protein
MNTAIKYERSTDGTPLAVRDDRPLPVTILPPGTGITPDTATLAHGTKTVAAAGTPEALGAGTCRAVIISPLRTNPGDAFLGASGANDTQHIEPPVVIEAPAGKLLNLAHLYVDVTVNGEGVGYITLN